MHREFKSKQNLRKERKGEREGRPNMCSFSCLFDRVFSLHLCKSSHCWTLLDISVLWLELSASNLRWPTTAPMGELWQEHLLTFSSAIPRGFVGADPGLCTHPAALLSVLRALQTELKKSWALSLSLRLIPREGHQLFTGSHEIQTLVKHLWELWEACV